MGCGASTAAPAVPPNPPDGPPVTLTMEKDEGESSGLTLYMGPYGFLRVHSIKPDSHFAGLASRLLGFSRASVVTSVRCAIGYGVADSG